MRPKISVLMCVHNADRNRWLDIAIQSILTQSFGDFEFVIVNDKSTDDSSKIIKKYSKHDSRIKLIHTKKNIGLTKALNFGLNHCEGENIVRQDADDVAHPFKLEKQLNAVKSINNVGIVGCWYEFIDKKGRKKKECYWNPEEEKDKELAGIYAGGSPLFRWEVIEELDGYNEDCYYAQDFDFSVRARQSGWKIINIKEVLYYWREHDKQISATNLKEQKKCAREITERLINAKI